MLTSVIIPTHNPKFLPEAIASVLMQQDAGDIEIVLVPNGAWSRFDHLEPLDPRCRIVPYNGSPGVIGAIKRHGFDAARGDVLIELDHDDILHPTALAKIRAALADGTDFVYSNDAQFHNETWTPKTFGAVGARNGWTYRPVEFRGHALLEAVAWEPTPASIGYIWFAPDHVRAWSRNGYEKSGGHDVTMDVADDHDLVIRTYLTGTMKHIDECVYFYRVDAGNTSAGDRNFRIQMLTNALYAKNIDAIVRRWCELNGLGCYDLGGAHNPAPGWKPCDRVLGGPDLRGPWPWPDSSVGAFRAFDFLEHLPDKMHTLSEMHRCLVPGGWALTCTPSALGRGAFMDPTHVSYWVKDSFSYVTDRNRAKYIGNTETRFQTLRLHEDEPYEISADRMRVVQSTNVPYVTADLVALKPGYVGPGEVHI